MLARLARVTVSTARRVALLVGMLGVAAPALAQPAEPERSAPVDTWGADEPETPPVPPPRRPARTEPAPCPCGTAEVEDLVPVRYELERIEVRGNTRTARSVVLRYLPFKPGQLIDANDSAFQLARYRLLGTGFFVDVEMSLEKGTQRGRVVLVVERRRAQHHRHQRRVSRARRRTLTTTASLSRSRATRASTSPKRISAARGSPSVAPWRSAERKNSACGCASSIRRFSAARGWSPERCSTTTRTTFSATPTSATPTRDRGVRAHRLRDRRLSTLRRLDRRRTRPRRADAGVAPLSPRNHRRELSPHGVALPRRGSRTDRLRRDPRAQHPFDDQGVAAARHARSSVPPDARLARPDERRARRAAGLARLRLSKGRPPRLALVAAAVEAARPRAPVLRRRHRRATRRSSSSSTSETSAISDPTACSA